MVKEIEKQGEKSKKSLRVLENVENLPIKKRKLVAVWKDMKG